MSVDKQPIVEPGWGLARLATGTGLVMEQWIQKAIYVILLRPLSFSDDSVADAPHHVLPIDF